MGRLIKVDEAVEADKWITDADFLDYLSRNDKKEKDKIKKVTTDPESTLSARNHYKQKVLEKVKLYIRNSHYKIDDNIIFYTPI
jgi:hypothetical protein